jgi:ABC-type Na+ efflux pump permease subunit
MVCVMLLSFAAIFVVAWTMHRERSSQQFIEQMFPAIFVTFLLPIFCLAYGSAGIASDREEQTLVYLLVSPMPRPLVFLAKCSASTLLALVWTIGGMSVICLLAGQAGRDAWQILLPAIFWSTVAYVALFLLFSVTFRRATIVALIYALFIETFVGNMPGMAKRLAVSFYTRCLIFDAGSVFGVSPSGPGNPILFGAMPGPMAQTIIILIGVGLFFAGMAVFSKSEYSR